MWNTGWAPTNASKWQMGFNSVFKGLKATNDTQYQGIVYVLPAHYFLKKMFIFVCWNSTMKPVKFCVKKL
jgi:hypothetical protein